MTPAQWLSSLSWWSRSSAAGEEGELLLSAAIPSLEWGHLLHLLGQTKAGTTLVRQGPLSRLSCPLQGGTGSGLGPWGEQGAARLERGCGPAVPAGGALQLLRGKTRDNREFQGTEKGWRCLESIEILVGAPLQAQKS